MDVVIKLPKAPIEVSASFYMIVYVEFSDLAGTLANNRGGNRWLATFRLKTFRLCIAGGFPIDNSLSEFL